MDAPDPDPHSIFADWKQRTEAAPECCASISARIALTVDGERGGTWLFDSSRVPALREYDAQNAAADCRVEIAEQDFQALAAARAEPQSAFLTGRLRIAGELEAAIQCTRLFDLLTSTNKGQV